MLEQLSILSNNALFASIVGGIIVAAIINLFVYIKYIKDKIKKAIKPLIILSIISIILYVFVFLGLQIYEIYTKNQELSKVQTLVDNYIKGHYPAEFEKGHKLKVIEINNKKIVLSFEYLKKNNNENFGYPQYSYDEKVQLDIINILKNNGYGKELLFVRQLPTYSLEELDEYQKSTGDQK